MAASSSTMAMRRFMHRQGYRLCAYGESSAQLPLSATIGRRRRTFAPAAGPAADVEYSRDSPLPRTNLLDAVSAERAARAPPRAAQKLAGVARAAGDRHRLNGAR